MASNKGQVPAGDSRIGRGTRWTEEQISILLDAVKNSSTAKAGFALAAEQLGKNVGTVQQKYYNVQRQLEGGMKRGKASVAKRGGENRSVSLPSAVSLRSVMIDDLIKLAQDVKTEIDRRREELDAGANLFK